MRQTFDVLGLIFWLVGAFAVAAAAWMSPVGQRWTAAALILSAILCAYVLGLGLFLGVLTGWIAVPFAVKAAANEAAKQAMASVQTAPAEKN